MPFIHSLKRRLNKLETGQSLVLLAIAFVALIALVGITTDVSLMFVRFTQLSRAVDSASIAAANQLRQDREVASIRLAANQFIEFYGLDPQDVQVRTCDWIEDENEKLKLPELCPRQDFPDGSYVFLESKIVEVKARVISPTVFLSLLGIPSFPLEATAYSETAALDVVLIMDVSESMLRDTNYSDWANVEEITGDSPDDPVETHNMGVIYIPPRVGICDPGPGSVNQAQCQGLETGVSSEAPYLSFGPQDNTVFARLWQRPETDRFYPGENTTTPGDPSDDFIEMGDFTQSAPIDRQFSRGTFTGVWDYDNGLWRAYLLADDQFYVNQHLYYTSLAGYPSGCDTSSISTWLGDPDCYDTSVPSIPKSNPVNSCDPTSDTNCRVDPAFEVRYVDDAFDGNGNYVGAGNGVPAAHPRPECRVRFSPAANQFSLDLRQGYEDNAGDMFTLRQLYDDINGTYPDTFNVRRFDGFEPVYDFYGCCNDPDGDGTFEDLVCQPFKDARNAAFGFFERLDFTRGDRAAVVSFARSAYLLNPYVDTDPGPGVEQRPAMIDSGQVIFGTVRDLVGVRAEPNFYEWEVLEDASADENDPGSGWLRDPVTLRNQFVAGSDQNGEPRRLYVYEEEPDEGDADYDEDDDTASSVNYPVRFNCEFQNVALSGYQTQYYGSLQSIMEPHNYLRDLGSPRIEYRPDYYNEGIQSVDLYDPTAPDDLDRYSKLLAYEFGAGCRDTNIGAALREGNNALLEDARAEGRVWIMVLLSDGAAGASDPVRRNDGRDIKVPDPLFDNCEEAGFAPGSSECDALENRFGDAGKYGSLGLCPIGHVPNPTTLAGPFNPVGELLKVGEPGSDEQFNEIAYGTGDVATGNAPYCLDEWPHTRSYCSGDYALGGPYEGSKFGFRPRLTALDIGRNGQDASRWLWDLEYVDYKDPRFRPSSLGPSDPWEPDGSGVLQYEYPTNYPSKTAWNSDMPAPLLTEPFPDFADLFPDEPGPQDPGDIIDWNQRAGNYLDVDLGGFESTDFLPIDEDCAMYDVDDYARDWVDVVALQELDPENAEAQGNRAATQLPIIFTIGFGLDFTTRKGLDQNGIDLILDDPDHAEDHADDLCRLNPQDCLGEQLLRYIADAGDNNRIDNDYWQVLNTYGYSSAGLSMRETRWEDVADRLQDDFDMANIDVNYNFRFGARGPCQTTSVNRVPDRDGGNYFSLLGDLSDPLEANNLSADEAEALWGASPPATSCGNYYNAPSQEELQFVFDDIASRMFTRIAR